MTADVRRAPRRGTTSRLRSESAGTGARTRDRRMRMADASFARSFDPCVSILTMHEGVKASSWWGDRFRYHGWANSRKWEEPALGPDDRTLRGSPRVTALARERRGTSTRKEVKAFVPARITSPGSCSYVVFQLQKSEGDLWPRISSANALQKERSGSSERGPSSERRLAGETVGRRLGRKGGRASGSPALRG